MQDIIIVGAFHETIELCEQCGFNIIGLVDKAVGSSYCGYSILGKDEDAELLFKKYNCANIVIGPDSAVVKRKLYNIFSKVGFNFATVISPKAMVSKTAHIGEGCVIQSGVNISANTTIGRFCKINFNSNIMHDVSIADFTIIAPNAVILGRTKVGEGTYIGANSTIEHDSIVSDGIIIPPATYFSNKSNE